MEINFLHVLGIVWIFVSPEIFKKSINLKCLCFPVPFAYSRNPLSPCSGNCMDFCVTPNILEIYNFGIFVIFHTFSILWKSIFTMFWQLYGFPYDLEIVGISVSLKIFMKSINLKCSCFPVPFTCYHTPLST